MKTLIPSAGLACLLCLSAFFGAANASGATIKKSVLLLFPYQFDLPAGTLALRAIQEEFSQATDLTLDLYVEYLDLNRFPEEATQQQMWRLLATKYNSKPIDLILVYNEAMLNSWLEHRGAILPNTPVVFFDFTAERLTTRQQPFPPDVIGVTGLVDYVRSVQWIMRARPAINEIVIVHGAGKTDRGFLLPIETLQKSLHGQIKFTDLSDLPLVEIKRRVAALPKSSVVVYTLMFEDAAGVKYLPINALRELADISTVPIIAGYDQFIGTGTIGGSMYSVEHQARQAAKLGLRILRGEPPSAIPTAQDQDNPFIFDHLALQRFDIPLSALPPGSIVKNRQYSYWELHQSQIIAVSAVFTILIVLVLFLLGITRQLNHTRLALARLNANLETQVQERTATLRQTNQRLEEEITERRQVEEKLRQLSRAVEQSDSTIVITDLNGTIEFVNPAFERVTGYRAQDALGQNPRLLKSGRMPPETYTNLWQTITRGEVWHGELYNRKKNGELYWESATISPVRDPAGNITHFVAIKNDITARKQTEEALKQSEAKYRLLAETSTDVIWTINEAQQFTYISPAILQLRGLTPEEAMRETVTEAVCPEFLPRIAESFQKSAEFRKAGGTDFVDHMEIQQPHKDGSRVWVEIITRELYDDKGERIGALGISRNITARKQAEAALREYTKRLEELQAQLREQAIRDPLTGAFNRRYLLETLERELARAARDHDPLSLVMIDLDHFKVVNDTYGHLAGDWALQYLVQLLERKTRKSDIVCRYGGEEFVVLLPQTSLADAMRRAEEWRAALQNSPAHFSNETIAFTISIGVASNNPLELTSDHLLSLADRALYAAKQGGRNRVAAPPSAMQ